MRKRSLAVVSAIFCLASFGIAQDSTQANNRDRAMTVPSSHGVATPVYEPEARLPQGATTKGNPSSPREGQARTSHVEALLNSGRENAPPNSDVQAGQSAPPSLAWGQSPTGGRYVFGQSDYITPLKPRSVVTCDFNGDGVPDLAVSNSTDASITVLLGRPDATMVPAPSFSVGHNFPFLGCGDFNQDGFADLVTVSNDGYVDVYLSTGKGAFQTPMEYSAPVGLQDVTVADLDGDGNLDLITEGNWGSVLVFYGQGDGTFAPYSSYPVNGYSHGPAT